MALLVKEGFGQLEPNHLSAQRNGQIYAQLPCESSIEKLENAQFVKYDYANKEVRKEEYKPLTHNEILFCEKYLETK